MYEVRGDSFMPMHHVMCFLVRVTGSIAFWPIPETFEAQGLYVSRTTRLGSSSPSSATIQPRTVYFWQEGYIDMVKTTESISEFRLPGIRL